MNLLLILITCFQTISLSDVYTELNINQNEVEKLNTALVLKYANENNLNKHEKNDIGILHIFAMDRTTPVISRWDLQQQTYRKKIKPWNTLSSKKAYENMSVISILYQKKTKKLLAKGNIYHLNYYEKLKDTDSFKRDNELLHLYEEKNVLVFFNFIANKDIIFAITESNKSYILSSFSSGWNIKTIDEFLKENDDEYF